jgi:hypothetical protein
MKDDTKKLILGIALGILGYYILAPSQTGVRWTVGFITVALSGACLGPLYLRKRK